MATTTTSPTRREAELRDVEAYADTFRHETELFRKRLADLDQEIAEAEAALEEMDSKRSALMDAVGHGTASAAEVLELRDAISRRQAGLRDLQEIRSTLADKHSYAHTQHAAVYQDVGKARVALQREPAEDHLLLIDAAFREIEKHWRAAAAEGHTLLNQRGDEWALNILRRWEHSLNSVGFRNGIWTPEFPRIEEPS